MSLQNFDKYTDNDALKMIYNKYFKCLVVYSMSYTHRADIAEDIVQDIIVNFFEKGRLTEVTGSLHAYLRGAVIKSSIKYNRDHQKYYFEELEYEAAEELLVDIDERADTSIVHLLASIEQLPPRSREVIKKIIFENKKHSDVAKDLSISTSSVRTLYYNALKKLKSSIRETYILFF